jgi:hypothetical protein
MVVGLLVGGEVFCGGILFLKVEDLGFVYGVFRILLMLGIRRAKECTGELFG